MTRPHTDMAGSQPLEGFCDAHLYDQRDLSDEAHRTYVFGPGRAYRIDLPLVVAVKKTARGDTHRVIDAGGICHYIPAGWIAIFWVLKGDTAIPLPDLSEQMSEAQEIEAQDDGDAERLGIIDIDDLATGIFKAVDELEEEGEVPTSREVEERDDPENFGRFPHGAPS